VADYVDVNASVLFSDTLLDKTTAEKAIRSLVPLISQGMQKNMSDQSGVQSLVNALSKGNCMRN